MTASISRRHFYVKLSNNCWKIEIFSRQQHTKVNKFISFISIFYSVLDSELSTLDFFGYETKDSFLNVALLLNSVLNKSEVVLNLCVTCKQIGISPKETHNPQNYKHSKTKSSKFSYKITNSVTFNICKDRYWWKTTYSP